MKFPKIFRKKLPFLNCIATKVDTPSPINKFRVTGAPFNMSKLVYKYQMILCTVTYQLQKTRVERTLTSMLGQIFTAGKMK